MAGRSPVVADEEAKRALAGPARAPSGGGMRVWAGRSPVVADEEQKRALADLGRSRERGEADRARAVLLTLSGWTSPESAMAFGVREDTVRLWRGAFMADGVEALRTRVPPGPAPNKAERAPAAAEEELARTA